jgi:hypothetical protein
VQALKTLMQIMDEHGLSDGLIDRFPTDLRAKISNNGVRYRRCTTRRYQDVGRRRNFCRVEAEAAAEVLFEMEGEPLPLAVRLKHYHVYNLYGLTTSKASRDSAFNC